MITKKLFLASSSELKEDRKEFEIFINRKNKDWVARGVFLELVVWEDFLDAVSNTRLQDEYNQAIRECDLFVMLFWTKVGPYTGEEFETAFGQFKATSRPFIFTYFKDADINTGTPNRKDLMSLWAFQEKLDALGHFYTRYKSTDELHFKFNRQLDKLAAKGFIAFDPSDAESAPGNRVNLTGGGAIAQGAGPVAVGRGGVMVDGDNRGSINTGTQIGGDLVGGDNVLGDKIGSQVNTGGGAYIGGSVSAGGDFVGRDQITTKGVAPGDLESLFAALLSVVAQQAPSEKQAVAVEQVQALKSEVAKGEQAEDGKIARILDGLADMVPKAVGAILSAFSTPNLIGIAGPVTRFVLDKFKGS